MKNYIPVSRVEGVASRQAHCDLPEGTYEREMSKEGFFGPAAFFHHRHPPTGWTEFEGPLRPRALDLTQLPVGATSPWSAAEVLANASCRVRFWRLSQSMDQLARNADGDELLFVHSGEAELYCDFGHLGLRAGDYVMLPRGTMWRLEIAARDRRAVDRVHQRELHAPRQGPRRSARDLRSGDPRYAAHRRRRSRRSSRPTQGWQVEVKRRGAISRITYPFNPLDAIGWHGELAPVRLNVRDIRPLMSHRYHLPPSAHTTFLSSRFVVCTFVPRPFETDPKALKVPFFHNNDDYDEVIFYHAGDFFSRDNIHPGMLTYHPAGFTHGPHPKALTRMFEQTKPATDEYAVMIDTRDPIDVSADGLAVEWAGYVDSWKGK